MLVQLIGNAGGISSVRLVGETSLERQWLSSVAQAGSLILSDFVSGSAVFEPFSNLPDSIIGTQVVSEIEEPAVYDFEVIRNQDLSFDFSFFENEEDLDLSQFEDIRLGFKSVVSNAPFFTLSLGSGLTIEGVNILKVSIDSDLSLSFPCGVLKYDLLFVKDSANRYYVKGDITVIESVTR